MIHCSTASCFRIRPRHMWLTHVTHLWHLLTCTSIGARAEIDVGSSSRRSQILNDDHYTSCKLSADESDTVGVVCCRSRRVIDSRARGMLLERRSYIRILQRSTIECYLTCDCIAWQLEARQRSELKQLRVCGRDVRTGWFTNRFNRRYINQFLINLLY